MPAGASPIDAFISIRLKEPLRKEPQIATTLAITYPVGLIGLEIRLIAGPELPPANGWVPSMPDTAMASVGGAPVTRCHHPQRRVIQ
mgnify:CR=1 FL=1